jgi:predicted DNA-binding WGR domain protein
MVIRKTLLESEKSFYSIELHESPFKKQSWFVNLKYGKRNTLGQNDSKEFPNKHSALAFCRNKVYGKTTFKGYKIIKDTQAKPTKALTSTELVAKLRKALEHE